MKFLKKHGFSLMSAGKSICVVWNALLTFLGSIFLTGFIVLTITDAPSLWQAPKSSIHAFYYLSGVFWITGIISLTISNSISKEKGQIENKEKRD